MILGKRRTAAISVGLALSVSACAEGPSASHDAEQPLPSLAENAPHQVVTAAAASVAIRNSEMQGSGEVISVNGRRMVLTAGHVGKLTAGPACGGVEIDMAQNDTAQKLPVYSSAGVYEGAGFRDRDVALLGVKDGALGNVPAASLATQLPAKGEEVYIVSWQPEGVGSSMGSQRNPVVGPIRHPAVIGATFQGKINENVVVFTPNGNSYDAMSGERIASDDTFKSEGSGSAVVNAEGQVVAEAAKGSANSLAAYPNQQAELYRMLGDSFDTTNGVALGNVVTAAGANDLATRQLAPANECPLP